MTESEQTGLESESTEVRRTNFLELEGELARAELIGEIDFPDTTVSASHYDHDSQLLSLIDQHGTISVYAVGQVRGEAPKSLLDFDTELGPIRQAAFGTHLRREERIAVVATAARPHEVAVLTLTDGGQFRRPEVVNVLAPSEAELRSADITALALGRDESESYVAVAYGREVLVHRLGVIAGRGALQTREESAGLSRMVEADAEQRGIELEPIPSHRDQMDIATQKMEPWWRQRFAEPVIGLSFGEVYRRYGESVFYAICDDGTGGAYGVDQEHWPRGDFGRHVEHPWSPPELLSFTTELPVTALASLNAGTDKLTGHGNHGQLSLSSREGEYVSGTVRVHPDHRINRIDGNPRYLQVATARPDDTGGTLSVLDLHPQWGRP